MRFLKPFIHEEKNFIFKCNQLDFDYFTISVVTSQGLKIYDYVDKEQFDYRLFIDFDFFLQETYRIKYNCDIFEKYKLIIESSNNNTYNHFGTTDKIRIVFYKNDKIIDIGQDYLNKYMKN